MRALVKSKREEGIWLEDQPVPEVGPNDVKIRIHKTAICGTDVHIYNWDEWAQETIPVPMAVGHEFVGEIVEVGSHVRGFAEGDRVSGEGHITCGYCRNCRAGKRHLCRNTVGVGVNRSGAFAEFLVIPATNAFKLPDNISDDIASFLDPLGNAAHTALSFDLVGEDVLITGAGPIGCMAVAIARHCGARHVVITDVNPYRLELARKMGASLTLDASRDDIRDGDGAPRHDRGIRRGAGDERQRQGLHRPARPHEPRGQGLHPGYPAPRRGHRLDAGDLQGARAQGHLWPRDVRDLVQDDLDAPVRPRRLPHPHPPLPRRRLPEGLRRDALGQERQGHPRLGVAMKRAALLAGSLLVLAAACGDDSDDGTTAAQAAASAQAAQAAAAEAQAAAEAANVAREEAAAQAEEARAAAEGAAEEEAEIAEGEENLLANPLIDCTAEANYNACIVRTLRHPSSPREFEALINALRETGQRDRACDLMRHVISRYPTSPAARRFNEFVRGNCN